MKKNQKIILIVSLSLLLLLIMGKGTVSIIEPSAVCGNNICEPGEASDCLPCYAEPCPLEPCFGGSCPLDCLYSTQATCSSLELWNCYSEAECLSVGGNWCTSLDGYGWCSDLSCPAKEMSRDYCQDSDWGDNFFKGGYTLVRKEGQKEFIAEADSCQADILLEQVCLNDAISTLEVDCSIFFKDGVCAYDSELRAYCRDPYFFTTDKGNMKVKVTAQLVMELDRALAEAESLFGSIRTEPGLDGVNGYPVDFVREKLFQRYLIAFLNGDYGAATQLHTRIMTGIMGSTQDTVRRLDWALANYYNTLLTDPAFAEAQRAGIRGTLAPAISIVEQLQWTGISLIRRQMDRNDIYETTIPLEYMGDIFHDTGFYDLSLSFDNPFLSATTNWPVEIGLACFNYETGTLDKIIPRRELFIEDTSATIPRSSFANPMHGMVTNLIDERLQGLNDCTCMELAGMEFFCNNNLLQELACLGGDPSESGAGSLVDPLTPALEEPSFDDIAAATGGIASLCSLGGGGAGGLAGNLRAGICRTGLSATVSRSIQCISNSRPRAPRIGDWDDLIRQDLQCLPRDDEEEQPPEPEPEEPICTVNDERPECAEARRLLEEALSPSQTNNRGNSLRNSATCWDCDVAGAVGSTNNGISTGSVSLVLYDSDRYCSGDGVTHPGCTAVYNWGGVIIHISRDSGLPMSETLFHELEHLDRFHAGIACGDLILPDGDSDSCPAHHRDGSMTRLPGPDDPFPGGCASPSDTFDAMTTCPMPGATPESGSGPTAPVVDPLCSRVTPAPDGGGQCNDISHCLTPFEGNRIAEENSLLRHWNGLGPDCPADDPYCVAEGGPINEEMLMNIIIHGPDCNFADAPCNIAANLEGSAAYGADLSGLAAMDVGCSSGDRPINSEDGGLCSAGEECGVGEVPDLDLFGRSVCSIG